MYVMGGVGLCDIRSPGLLSHRLAVQVAEVMYSGFPAIKQARAFFLSASTRSKLECLWRIRKAQNLDESRSLNPDQPEPAWGPNFAEGLSPVLRAVLSPFASYRALSQATGHSTELP